MSNELSLWSTMVEHLKLARDLRALRIHFYPDRCRGAWQCFQVCPVDCWTPDRDRRVVTFHGTDRCIACGACVLQCPNDAIELSRPRLPKSRRTSAA